MHSQFSQKRFLPFPWLKHVLICFLWRKDKYISYVRLQKLGELVFPQNLCSRENGSDLSSEAEPAAKRFTLIQAVSSSVRSRSGCEFSEPHWSDHFTVTAHHTRAHTHSAFPLLDKHFPAKISRFRWFQYLFHRNIQATAFKLVAWSLRAEILCRNLLTNSCGAAVLV